MDRYKLAARAHEECFLPQDFLMIRQSVLEGKVQINTLDKTTIQKAHQHVVGASSPCIKKRCGCKFGCCKKEKCGCSKVIGIRCHGGCSCNGNCSLFGYSDDNDSIDDGKKE